MANTYYDSQLTAEEIEQVLEAINGILTQANNGKVLAINNGKLEARSVQWGGGEPVLEPLSVTANGDYTPEAGVDGFDEVHVSVPSSSPTIQSLFATQNGTYNPPSGVDGYAPVTVNVSGGGSDVIISQNPPTSDVGHEGQYYIYEEETSTIKYGIQIITAGRGTNYSFTYWGARDIDFIFTDGNDEYHLRDFSNAHCYWAGGTREFAQQDNIINGQTNTYYENSALPGWYEITADVPSGLSLAKIRICGRNDGWGDFWRTFMIGQWVMRRSFMNTLISEQDLVLADWDTSSTSAYTEFTLSSPMQPINVITSHLYRKIGAVWVQYC